MNFDENKKESLLVTLNLNFKFQKSNDETTNRRVSIDAVSPKKKKSVVSNSLGSFSKGTMEQRDRSLTVIIPRAKFHPGKLGDDEAYKAKSSSSLSVNQNKLINYLDSSPSSSKTKNVSCP